MKAERMGGANPLSLMGSNPLFNGKNAPPHPPIVPQKMGPKIGMLKSLAGSAAPAAAVNLVTTEARNVSNNNTAKAYDMTIEVLMKRRGSQKNRDGGKLSLDMHSFGMKV